MQTTAARRHVVFCADRNYHPYFGIAAYSLLCHNAGHGLAITLVTDEIDDAVRRRFDRLADEFGVPISIYFVSARDREDLREVGLKGHLGIASYFRLLIPRALPPELGRVLYLDADVIVDGDIVDLLSGPSAGRLLGVCADPIGRRVTGDAGYFNTGVMCIDLAQWRARDVSGRAIAYAAGRKDLRYCDQDALNAVIDDGSVEWLGLQYNYMVFDRLRSDYRQMLDSETAKVETPKILHFTGQIKPWHGWYTGEHKEKYLDYAGRSPWRDAGLTLDRPANLQQEMWMGEAAEKAADLRKAVHHYKLVAQSLLDQQVTRKRPAR